MPGLGEEAPVGEDVVVAVVGRVLQEHTPVMRVVTQPGQERGGRTERSAGRIVSLAELLQIGERLMEYGQVAAFGHRTEEGR